jgi:hypothetical protein
MTREMKLLRSTHNLTVRELDRLLHRYDLSPAARDIIQAALWETIEYLAEIGAESGRWIVHPMVAYQRANPLYGPDAPPPSAWDDADDVPF